MTLHAPAAGFDEHTAVRTDDPGGWHAYVDGAWSGYRGAHGGYLAAIALRALHLALGERRRPARSLTAHFLRPVAPGRLEVDARLERAGRSSAVATARLLQDGEPAAVGVGAFATGRPSLGYQAPAFPLVPPPERCEPLGFEPVPGATAGQQVEHRPASALPLSGGDRPEVLVWMRLTEARSLDDLAVTFLADAAVPALYGMLRESVAMPTTDMTLHFIDAAVDDPWVLGAFRTTVAGGGHVIEDGELWARDGRLLVQARQLRRMLG
jgi:acyl-CoA thioesterase